MASVQDLIARLPHEALENDEDPDAHATLREFVDYTEYLPSDLFRSLQLIRNLDVQEADHRGHLEWLTKEFANLPARATANASSSSAGPNGIPQTANGIASNSVRRGDRPISDEEMEMRLRISRSINASIRARQESAAEASKFHQNISRHYWRISAIRSKLNEVTVPSRDPTPVSPRKPRNDKSEESTHCRITLRLNASDRTPASRGRRRGGFGSTARSRHPPVTPAGNEDDWEDIPDTVQPHEKQHKRKKPPGSGPKRGPKPPVDLPFSGGAPTHDGNGIPIPGHLLPWNRLTNEELARLRKRMKKNSGWTPSVTMIIRELESLGRGPKHKDNFADQRSGHLGDDFLKIYGPEDGGIGDPEKIAPDDGAGVRENKGMRLNRAKKRKREEERKEKEREAERERHEAEREKELARLKIEEDQRREQDRLDRLAREKAERERAAREAREAAAREAIAAAAREKAEKDRLAKEAREEKAREKALKKEQDRAAAAAAANSRKTRSASISTTNTAITATTGTTTTAEDEDEDMPDADAPPPPPPPPRRLGRPPKNPAAAAIAAASFKPGHKRAASNIPAGVPITDTKRSKRGVSAAAPPPPPPAPIGRKTPGPKIGNRVTKAGAGGRKKGLIAGRRRVSAAAAGNVKEEEGEGDGAGEGEWIDEDEEDLNRYCLCDEVSRGTMVACENPQCPKVWFHIDCVELEEEEADSLKWYCPLCKDDQAPGKRGGKRRKKV